MVTQFKESNFLTIFPEVKVYDVHQRILELSVSRNRLQFHTSAELHISIQ